MTGTEIHIGCHRIWINRAGKCAGGGIMVKGYFVSNGYMGYVDGEYLLFADESDYMDYIED